MPNFASRLIGHGAPGCLSLDGFIVDTLTLADPSVATRLRARVQGAAHVDVLSCRLARGPEGRNFIRHLARVVGVPVFASSQDVGPAALGGTYMLDFGYDPHTNTDVAGHLADPVPGLTTLLAQPARYVSATFTRGYFGTQANQQAPQDVYVFGFAGEDTAVTSVTFRQDDSDGDGRFGSATGLQGNDLNGELVIQFSGPYGEGQSTEAVFPGYLNFRETPNGKLHVLGFLLYPAPNTVEDDGPLFDAADMKPNAAGWLDYIDNGGLTPDAPYDASALGYANAATDPGYQFTTTSWTGTAALGFPSAAGGNNTYRMLSDKITDNSTNIGLVLETMTADNADWVWEGNNLDKIPTNNQDRSSFTNAANSGLLDVLNAYLAEIVPLSISDPVFIETDDLSETDTCELAYTIVLPDTATASGASTYSYAITTGTDVDANDYDSTPPFSIGEVYLADGTGPLTPVVQGDASQWHFTDGVTTFIFTDNGDGTLTVPESVTQFDFCLNVVQDTAIENNETITLDFGSVTGIGTIIDNDNPIRVNNVMVNESSDWAVFEVEFTADGSTLDITSPVTELTATEMNNGTDGDADIEVWAWDGTSWAWTPLAGGISDAATQGTNTPTNGTPVTAYVRVAIDGEQDDPVDRGEQFTLTVSYGTPSTVGTGTIMDDGTGDIFTTGTTDPTTSLYIHDNDVDGSSPDLDDDRPLSVTDACVAEVSPFAVFEVDGGALQYVSLRLVPPSADATPSSTTSATAGTDFSTAMQVWDGSGWVDLSTVTVTDSTGENFVQLNSAGHLLVRHAIFEDADETPVETYELQASNTGGTTSTGFGSIHEDGACGTLYPDLPPTGTPANPVSATIEISSVEVNEASDIAINRICAVDEFGDPIADMAGYELEGLIGEVDPNAENAATITDFDLHFWNGSAWVAIDDDTPPVLDASGCVYIRSSLVEEQDSPIDNGEVYSLTLPSLATGTVTIYDDGSSVIFTEAIDPVSGPVTSTDNLDNDGDRETIPSPSPLEAYFDCSWSVTQQDTLGQDGGSFALAMHAVMNLQVGMVVDSSGNTEIIVL